MKLPLCAGTEKGRTTWDLCTQPFPAIFFARGCFHDLNPWPPGHKVNTYTSCFQKSRATWLTSGATICLVICVLWSALFYQNINLCNWRLIFLYVFVRENNNLGYTQHVMILRSFRESALILIGLNPYCRSIVVFHPQWIHNLHHTWKNNSLHSNVILSYYYQDTNIC
jgi:hypothetical protein